VRLISAPAANSNLTISMQSESTASCRGLHMGQQQRFCRLSQTHETDENQSISSTYKKANFLWNTINFCHQPTILTIFVNRASRATSSWVSFTSANALIISDVSVGKTGPICSNFGKKEARSNISISTQVSAITQKTTGEHTHRIILCRLKHSNHHHYYYYYYYYYYY